MAARPGDADGVLPARRRGAFAGPAGTPCPPDLSLRSTQSGANPRWQHLVPGGARERPLGRDVATEGWHRIVWIEAIGQGGMGYRLVRRKRPVGVQVVRRRRRPGERPFLFIAPAPADEHPTLRGLVSVTAAHDIDAHRCLAVDAVVDTLQPMIEPALLEGVEIDGRVGRELRIARVARVRAAMGPGSDNQPLRALLALV